MTARSSGAVARTVPLPNKESLEARRNTLIIELSYLEADAHKVSASAAELVALAKAILMSGNFNEIDTRDRCD